MLNDFLSAPPGAYAGEAVNFSTLQQLLVELFGPNRQTGLSTGTNFPVGAAATGTVPMFLVADVTSLSSPAGATPALKSYSVPAAALSTIGARGLKVRGWGSFANNANAKTVVLKFGATTLVTITATANAANSWYFDAVVFVRTATTQTAVALARQGETTATVYTVDSTPGETLSGAISLACSGTQTSAADIIQDGFTVELIP